MRSDLCVDNYDDDDDDCDYDYDDEYDGDDDDFERWGETFAVGVVPRVRVDLLSFLLLTMNYEVLKGFLCTFQNHSKSS